MKEEIQKSSRVYEGLQKVVINLSNELLKRFQISKIIYICIKLLEHLQMVYFLMRTNSSSFLINLLQGLLKYTSANAIVQLYPDAFNPLLYIFFSALFSIVIMSVLVGVNSGWNQKTPSIIKGFIPILCSFFYLFKTVLFIPILKLILISLMPSARAYLNITETSLVTSILGIFSAVLFGIVTLYQVILFKDANPFSQLPFSGQKFLKSLTWMLFKLSMVLYTIMDMKGEYYLASTITFTILYLVFVVYNHIQIGLYKTYYREVENYFLFACLIFGIIILASEYNGQITTFFYIIPLNILTFLLFRWMTVYKKRRIQATRFLMIEESKQLEGYIINLLHVIDGLNLRQNRVMLAGFIQFHKRQCNIGLECPCNKLCDWKKEPINQTKLEAFKFVITLLTESKRKFPECNTIDLLLGLVYHYRIKNSLQAIYAITKMATCKNANTLDRIYGNYYLQQIEKQMIEVDQFEVNKTVQINKYFEYANKMVKFQDDMEKCTKHHVQFWKLVMDSNPDIRHLEELGTQITRSKDQLKNQFDSMVAINANSVHLLTIYGRFLLEVTNQESYNVKYIEKAQIIIKNIKESSKIYDDEGKYDQNSKTAVVIISGDDGRIGIVVHTNNLVKDLIGYHRSELLEKNVATIMPKIYGEHHHQILKRYVGSSKSKVNGHERVVPALTKDGFMLPIAALTKVLPSLINGIQIVAFLSTFEEIPEDEQQMNKSTYFLLYRSDTERIMGISEGCYKHFGISPNLVYGHPLNMNNELTIESLFGVSFEKGQDGKISASLEMGEVFCTLNTKNLKNQFVINSGTTQKEIIGQIYENEDSCKGVQVQVLVKLIQSTVYNKTPLKMLGLHRRDRKPKKILPQNNKERSTLSFNKLNSQHKQLTKQKLDLKSVQVDQNKGQGDDFKNLKDFKNFISVKRQPSAITAMSTICLLFIVILTSSILGLIFNYMEVGNINKNIIQLYRLTLQSEMVVPELLTQVEKQLYAYQLAKTNTTGFTSISNVNQTIQKHISQAKYYQLNLLPYKYYFNGAYKSQINEYDFFLSGSITSELHLQEEVINTYITTVETIIRSNLALYSNNNATQQKKSNVYQEYKQSQINMLYSIRNALNSSNEASHSWYNSKMTSRKIIIIAVNAAIMGVAILWVILLLPYILSVTKINNRVLSLFTLIPSRQISKLIYSCLVFLHRNLKEAVVNAEQIDFYEPTKTNGFQLGHQRQKSVLAQSEMQSPSAFNLVMTETHGQLRKNGPRGTCQTDNMFDIQQKFQKMNNSEDHNKKIIICKFIIISIFILGFALFSLFFSLSVIQSTQNNAHNYYLAGRRPALIRTLKMLLAQYLTNPTYQPANFSSIRSLNQGIINEFYTLEANLLYLNLGNNAALYNLYNNGDCCSSVSSYSSYTIFNEQLSTVECMSLNAGVFQKGLKTGVVSVLEDLRGVLSQYPTTVPENVHISKMLQYDQLVKYIETPMLAVMSSIQTSINSRIQMSTLVIVLSGSTFILIMLICWKFIWSNYLSTLNVKIWRTKGLLNLIPMRIITANNHLKNQFTSGQLQNAVR